MKKLLIALMISLAASSAAQGIDTEGYLLDHDSLTMVRCSQGVIGHYMNSMIHMEPRGDGSVTMCSGPGGRLPKMHECHNDNKLAQEVYQARLDRLCSVSLKPLSPESESIVINFELLTGTQNSIDHNYVGTQYVSSMALTAWKLWFNKHKEHLRICPIARVLYVDSLEALSE